MVFNNSGIFAELGRDSCPTPTSLHCSMPRASTAADRRTDKTTKESPLVSATISRKVSKEPGDLGASTVPAGLRIPLPEREAGNCSTCWPKSSQVNAKKAPTALSAGAFLRPARCPATTPCSVCQTLTTDRPSP